MFRNEVRRKSNNKAAEIRQARVVCTAQDSCKGKPVEYRKLVKKLLELCDSKTEHLPGLLPSVLGMRVILTQNIVIELGLINGMNGIFRQLVYEEDSVPTGVISETFSSNTRYTVATKIIQQAVTLFSLTLYLLYSKNYRARVCICL